MPFVPTPPTRATSPVPWPVPTHSWTSLPPVLPTTPISPYPVPGKRSCKAYPCPMPRQFIALCFHVCAEILENTVHIVSFGFNDGYPSQQGSAGIPFHVPRRQAGWQAVSWHHSNYSCTAWRCPNLLFLSIRLFLRTSSLLIRQKQYFSLKQKEGQDEVEFWKELKSLAEEADSKNLKYEDCICLMYMIGLLNRSLREKLGEGDLALPRVIKVLRRSSRPSQAICLLSVSADKQDQGYFFW
jgi:hypothetical protein